MENVKRVTLTGNWEAVTFTNASKTYLVKNFSDIEIYVSFEQDDEDDSSIKILPNDKEVITATPMILQALNFNLNTIYVKGTGEVEIQQIYKS